MKQTAREKETGRRKIEQEATNPARAASPPAPSPPLPRPRQAQLGIRTHAAMPNLSLTVSSPSSSQLRHRSSPRRQEATPSLPCRCQVPKP
ncbi:hypothetical protein M0R45_019699 [Rubus argutus]|uniref:Uncharacterized protein n=1 Tax=Rubus argutus TaxID=59490 RepID=A0AAW1X643_RUBAR